MLSSGYGTPRYGTARDQTSLHSSRKVQSDPTVRWGGADILKLGRHEPASFVDILSSTKEMSHLYPAHMRLSQSKLNSGLQQADPRPTRVRFFRG